MKMKVWLSVALFACAMAFAAACSKEAETPAADAEAPAAEAPAEAPAAE